MVGKGDCDAEGVRRAAWRCTFTSAHRTPEAEAAFVCFENAQANGFGVDHRGGGQGGASGRARWRRRTVLPVIGIPVKSSTLDGLDALLSTVQMPSGIPVATVAIDGAENAALLAVQMLALSDETLKNRLIAMKKTMAEGGSRQG